MADGGAYKSLPNAKAGQRYVKPNTGCPWPKNEIYQPLITGTVNWPGVMVQNTNQYNWIDTKGNPQSTLMDKPNNMSAQAFINHFQLKEVQFLGLSQRLQYILGSPSSGVNSTKLAQEYSVAPENAGTTLEESRVVERGRVCLVNYKWDINVNPQPANLKSQIIQVTMQVAPNMYAPSMMFLNLTTQGTKTKVLGHEAERGGWAVPCDAADFTSVFTNYPWLSQDVGVDEREYSVDQARNIPFLMNLKTQSLASEGAKTANIYYHGDEPLQFDAVPLNPEGVVFSRNVQGVTQNFLCEDNYSLVTNGPGSVNVFQKVIDPTNGEGLADTFKFGSRMIHYGTIDATRYPHAPAVASPRSKFGPFHRGFSTSPAFTVSMITPMWIYTDVPNSTVQTLDVQLMWGDTSENIVTGFSVQPFQISLIASQ